MITYQDFLQYKDRAEAVRAVIADHTSSEDYRIAIDADEYDRQKNVTIYQYVKTMFTASGSQVLDFTAANSRIASNFFHRLNTQRVTYSLGNGVSFVNKRREVSPNGTAITVDTTKDALGADFDTRLQEAAGNALKHGCCFLFWNVDRLHVFPFTEFAPLYDETTGILRAGVRFWRLTGIKPLTATLYEEDGYETFRTDSKNGKLEVLQPKRAYRQTIVSSEADGEIIVGEQNYGSLPVVPLWGSKLHQSMLVGLQRAIDSYDLIRSGFANDLSDCAQIYWIVSNAGGMTETELAKFRDRLKIQHIAVADTDNSAITPYTQEVPYNARQAYLDSIRAEIYECYGGLDVHTIAAGATNDHIDAAYQPMDEEADDFEYQLIQCIRQLLALQGIDDFPVFKRNRISNQMEQVQMVMMEAQYLDDETILQKLPNISVDEVEGILLRRGASSESRFDEEETPEDAFAS